jgi:hypothetical protein
LYPFGGVYPERSQQIGLTIPQWTLMKADKVIQ